MLYKYNTLVNNLYELGGYVFICGRTKNTIFKLHYDESIQEYMIEISEDVKSFEAPMILADFIKRGQREIGKEWSLRWVQQRVIPSERQNIGQILRENGMQFYIEFPFLLKNQGRSCQNECYIEPIYKQSVNFPDKH